eukprot:1160374-Pelagomonas_calceolata.AAC.7
MSLVLRRYCEGEMRPAHERNNASIQQAPSPAIALLCFAAAVTVPCPGGLKKALPVMLNQHMDLRSAHRSICLCMHHAAAATTAVQMWRPDGLLVAFPVMAYSFTAHPWYLGIFTSMQAPSVRRMTGVTDAVSVHFMCIYFIIVVVPTAVVGVFDGGGGGVMVRGFTAYLWYLGSFTSTQARSVHHSTSVTVGSHTNKRHNLHICMSYMN